MSFPPKEAYFGRDQAPPHSAENKANMKSTPRRRPDQLPTGHASVIVSHLQTMATSSAPAPAIMPPLTQTPPPPAVALTATLLKTALGMVHGREKAWERSFGRYVGVGVGT